MSSVSFLLALLVVTNLVAATSIADRIGVAQDYADFNSPLLSSIFPLLEKIASLEERFHELQISQAKLKSSLEETKFEKDELKAQLNKFEELAKVNILRSCAEYTKFGISTSGLYFIDPDGPLFGEPPFKAYCNFTTGATEVLNDASSLTPVQHCDKPGCYEKVVNYINGETSEPVPSTQIEALLQLSQTCVQAFQYDCMLAPLSDANTDFAWWTNRHGERNMFVCDCDQQAKGCYEFDTEGNKCNCNANMPALLSDTGLLTNMSALPVTKLNFGGLVHSVQSASFRLGALQCFGMVELEAAGSCADLKLAGVTRSGVYNVVRPGEQFYRVVSCDMDQVGFREVEQQPQDAPLVSVCGAQEHFSGHSRSVTFSSLLHSATNLPPGAGLDIGSGVFTAPLAGVYTVTWALRAWDDAGDRQVWIYLRHNGVDLHKVTHTSSYTGARGAVWDQGGRTVNLQLSSYDTLELYCWDCTAHIHQITFCVSLVHAL